MERLLQTSTTTEKKQRPELNLLNTHLTYNLAHLCHQLHNKKLRRKLRGLHQVSHPFHRPRMLLHNKPALKPLDSNKLDKVTINLEDLVKTKEKHRLKSMILLDNSNHSNPLLIHSLLLPKLNPNHSKQHRSLELLP